MTIRWNEVTIWWNEVTKGWNEVAWNEVVMERSDRNSSEIRETFRSNVWTMIVFQYISVSIPLIYRDTSMKLIPSRRPIVRHIEFKTVATQ